MNVSVELQERTKALKGGDKLSQAERLEAIQGIADVVLSTNIRPKDISEIFGVSRNTAMDWLNSAYILLEQESKLSREGLRNIHRGQIEYMTNKLIKQLEMTTDSQEQLAIHDRIIKYMDARARTNGLNSETVDHTHTLKPLEIRRSTPLPIQAHDDTTT